MAATAPQPQPAAATAANRTVVVVSGEDDITRARIAAALSGQPSLAVSDDAGLDPALAGADAQAADLLIAHWPQVTDREAASLRATKREREDMLIIAVCRSASARSARRAFEGGVDGLIFADAIETALLPTVAAVLAGQTTVPRELRASIRKPSLSFREKQILGLVVLGFTNGEIAARLFLAESTVKSHLSSAFTKLGVRSRGEAAALILDPQGSLGPGILGITPAPEQRP